MKSILSAFIFLLFAEHSSNAQLTLGVRYHHFFGDISGSFNGGVGPAIQYASNVYKEREGGWTSIVGASYSWIGTTADTIPTYATQNGVPIPGSYVIYSNVKLFNADMNVVRVFGKSKTWLPFVGGAVIFQLFTYDYKDFIPGVLDAETINEFLAGVSIGPVAGTYYWFSYHWAAFVKVEQTWGWVFTEGPKRVNYNGFDGIAGITIVFD